MSELNKITDFNFIDPVHNSLPIETVVLSKRIDLESSSWSILLIPDISSEFFRSEIDRLAAITDPPNPFFGYPFLSAAFRRLQPKEAAFLALVETIGETEYLRFFAPVAMETVGLKRRKILKVWSHMFAPSSSPLVDEGDKEHIFSKLGELLTTIENPEYDAIVFSDFHMSSSLASACTTVGSLEKLSVFSCKTERASLSPIGKSDYTTVHLSAKRRRTLHSNFRRLHDYGPLEFEKVTDLADILVRFEEFLLLETKGWKGRVGTSLHRIKNTAAFARQSVVNMAQSGQCSIRSLRLNGKAIASLIVFESNGYHFPWKIAYDERFGKYSVGNQLVVHFNSAVIKEPGFRGLDSLAASDNDTANRFWPDRLKMGTLVIGMGIDGRDHATSISRYLSAIHETRKFAKRIFKPFSRSRG